jgi:hypothetical protein
MTRKQALEFCKKGGIIKYDDMFYICWNKDSREFRTSIDMEHWIAGFLYYDPPTDWSIFRIVKV